MWNDDAVRRRLAETCRSTAGVLAAVAVLAACDPAPAAEPSTPATRPTAAGADCPKSGVTIRPGAAEAAMGLRVLSLELTNCGDAPYPLHGYPGVRVLDEHREELHVEVGEGSSGIAVVDAFDAPPTRITLAPGETATSGLLWRNTVTNATVPATTGSYLEVRPAAGAPWQPLDDAEEPPLTIDLGTTGKVGVRAWTSP